MRRSYIPPPLPPLPPPPVVIFKRTHTRTHAHARTLALPSFSPALVLWLHVSVFQGAQWCKWAFLRGIVVVCFPFRRCVSLLFGSRTDTSGVRVRAVMFAHSFFSAGPSLHSMTRKTFKTGKRRKTDFPVSKLRHLTTYTENV